MPIVKNFRRFHSNILSSSQVVSEISTLVAGSNVEQSGRSSAAPFTSNRPIRKKVCIADRRAMLESFVNKYRATNLGKFPSPTIAQKEVGGSYYLIRKMIQEMEYDFKISFVEKGLVKENKKQTKSEDSARREITIESSGSQVGLNSHITNNQPHFEDPVPKSVGNSDVKFELNEGLQPSTSSEQTENNNIIRDDTHNIETESHESPSEDNSTLEESELKVEKQHDGITNTMRDMPEQQKNDEVREKPTSIWGNLKSLATSFINIWK